MYDLIQCKVLCERDKIVAFFFIFINSIKLLNKLDANLFNKISIQILAVSVSQQSDQPTSFSISNTSRSRSNAVSIEAKQQMT